MMASNMPQAATEVYL